jgi:Alpha/beta hydrolase family
VHSWFLVGVVAIFALAGCSQATSSTSPPSSSPPGEESPASPSASESISGLFDANGRTLYIECLGTGIPTVVLEAGQGVPRADLAGLQEAVSQLTTTCSYDRANTGQSGEAPTPRSSQDVIDDVRSLLQTAAVPGPYVFVGHSAGGFFVQHYARRYPGEVVGVVSMNPVPPADPWLDEALPLFTEQERSDEEAYYRGENDESIDWNTSSQQLTTAPAPPDMPFELLISTDAQCEGTEPCQKSYSIYERIEDEIAQEWPDGRLSQIDASHNMYRDALDEVVEAIRRVLADAG